MTNIEGLYAFKLWIWLMRLLIAAFLLTFAFTPVIAQTNGYQLNNKEKRCQEKGTLTNKIATFRDAGITSAEIINAILDNDNIDDNKAFSIIQIVGLIYRGEWSNLSPVEAMAAAYDSCMRMPYQ